MTKKPRSDETPAEAVHRRLVAAVEQFLGHWRSLYPDGVPQGSVVSDATDLAERILSLSKAHSMPAIDAYLRYLAWSVSDLGGMLYEELTSPTSTRAFPSGEFTKLHHAFNAGFWSRFQCVRSDRRFRVGGRVDPEASLGLVCDWLGVDRSDAKKLEGYLCGLAREHDLNENEVLLARACSSVGCPGFLVTIAGEPSCPLIRQVVSTPGPRFPKMTGTITECGAFPAECPYPLEVVQRWAELRDELDKKRLQHPSKRA